MISQSDLIMVGLAFLIGYLDDIYGPQTYHYEDEIVIVDRKYQCPVYCGVNHSHSVYYEEGSDSTSVGMTINKSKLGKKFKPSKK